MAKSFNRNGWGSFLYFKGGYELFKKIKAWLKRHIDYQIVGEYYDKDRKGHYHKKYTKKYYFKK